MAEGPDQRALVEKLGVASVAERYIQRLRASLDSGGRSRDEGDADAWIEDAVIWGGDPEGSLDPQTRLELVVAAAEAAAGDDDVLWCIGDMPADHLVGDELGMGVQLHQARRRSDGVRRMFLVMQDYLRQHGHPLGWWADDWPQDPR